MPIRMLRPWLYSEKVNSLTVHSERFFIRLIMIVDDYGCFYANPSILKANLFPLLLDGVREADISRWMAECQKAGLIVLYEADSKKYLQVSDFRQRLDKSRAKFPLPTSVNVFPESVNEFPAETDARNGVEKRETRNGRKTGTTQRQPLRVFIPPSVEEVLEFAKGKGFTEGIARKAWEYYHLADWFDSHGKKVQNWKQKINNVWFTDEHKVKPVKESQLEKENKW